MSTKVPSLGKSCLIWQHTGSLTLLATVDELSSVDTLSCDEELSPLLETVWVTESNLGQGSTTAGVVDDILDKAIKKHGSRTLSWFTRGDPPTLEGALSVTFTIPLMYPWRSAKSTLRSLAAPFLCLTWALNTEPAPFLCPLITRPMVSWKKAVLRQLPGWHVDTRFDSRSFKLQNCKLYFFV